MRIFSLNESFDFPDPALASPEGLLAIGGDLKPQRLLKAYTLGIFPWYSEGEPILWWSPDPRFVLYPDQVKISKSMRPLLNGDKFRVSFDQAFTEVMQACSNANRIGQDGTWITSDMIEAYTTLHRLGYAHSVETWENDQLVGGLYGISIGAFFFGESMFTKKSNASKFALIHLADRLKKKKFVCIDCQQETDHLATLGAKPIKRSDFFRMLSHNVMAKTNKGSWEDWINISFGE